MHWLKQNLINKSIVTIEFQVERAVIQLQINRGGLNEDPSANACTYFSTLLF